MKNIGESSYNKNSMVKIHQNSNLLIRVNQVRLISTVTIQIILSLLIINIVNIGRPLNKLLTFIHHNHNTHNKAIKLHQQYSHRNKLKNKFNKLQCLRWKIRKQFTLILKKM